MELSLHILAILSLIMFSSLCARYFAHMFQLNSYTAAVQFGWMRENVFSLLPAALVLVLSVVCAFVRGHGFTYGYAFLAIGSLLLSLCYLPKKAKKPFACTARVIRMFVTLGILSTALFVLAVLLSGTGEFVILGLTVCCLPLLLVAANKINSPVEKAVRNHYIRDAKRILKDCPDLKVIGVTGSFGKTSVKYCLSSLLSAKFNVLMTPESYNTPMGVVKTIRASLRATHEIFVCEMGAKYVGDIKELCDIVHPQDGIVTSIGEQHLESFGTVENIIHTKYELADALPQNGKLFINISSETVYSHRPNRAAITYGLTGEADYSASEITVSGSGTSFTVRHGDEIQNYTTKLIGESNVVNILGSIAVAHEYGISLSDLVGAVRALRPVPHRMELLDRGGIMIIDDAFNSNPSGAKAALKTLTLFDAVKIIVTPGMIELGEKSDLLNAELGANAAAVCDYIVAVGEKQAKPIVKGARGAGFDNGKIHIAKTFRDAMDFVYAIDCGGKKKIVLLENDLPDNF